MGRARTAVAGVLDGVVGALARLRDRIAGDVDHDGDTGQETTAQGRSARSDDRVEESGPRPGGEAGEPTATGDELATTDHDGELATADGGGIVRSVRDRVGTGLEYQKTALRHPIAAQRAHVASLRETHVLSTDFLKEALVAGSARDDRIERIREAVDDDRTVRDDVRAAADVVDWGRAWRFGKYGYLAGRRYRTRLPVADEYAPVAGALAGGAYGAVSGVTDATVVDVDPDRLFDRIDAVSRLRDDPVARAQVARETIHAVDRRVGGDELPVDDVLDDDEIAEVVTREGEAVPDEIPRATSTGVVIEELVWGDPLPARRSADRRPGLPPAPGGLDATSPSGSPDRDSRVESVDGNGEEFEDER